MVSFDRTFFTSPVLVMPSQSVHQSPFGAPSFSRQAPSFSNFPSFGSNASLPQSYVSPSTSERRGRKRSRDEASENLDDRVSAVASKLEKSEEDWIYGPGMTLIKPGSGYVPDASTQSGTWVEEMSATKETERVESAALAVKQQEQDRPSLRSNKSQRLEVGSLSSQDFHSNRSSPTRDAAKSSTPVSSLSLDAAATPVVDDFTLTFGVGWRLMNDDSNISAAVRGWARYIENHYPVSNVKIHAESKGLQSYLVQADEGWYLFDENLRQGRLVSTDNQRCIQNLKSSSPVFEGAETMTASASPRATSPYVKNGEMDTDMN
ncbi:hypothetical protein MKZ38_007650 [Zalerion maritima]|uniref:Uncharacterized protein n=1 Tax=Zalerion maritima TaxID=339359 RepID=A0AAD5S051_9PEZI|nr:hypothetical protein MKZ38_007650 [Zalerion maritima]